MSLRIDIGFKPLLTPDLFHRVEYGRVIDDSRHGFNLLDILEIPKQGTPGYCIDTHRAAYWKGSTNSINHEAPVLAVVVARERRLRDEAEWSFGVVHEAVLLENDPAMKCIEAAEYGAPDILLALDALEQFVKPNR